MPSIIAPETQVRGQGDPAAFAVDPGDPEAWRAQIFRSIDSDSADGLPVGSEASALGLDSGKGKVHIRVTIFGFKVHVFFYDSRLLMARTDLLLPRL